MLRILQESDQGRFRNSLWIREASGVREIASAEEAHHVLTQWSQKTSSRACEVAIVAARSSLRGTRPAEEARKSFAAFAEEAGILLTK